MKQFPLGWLGVGVVLLACTGIVSAQDPAPAVNSSPTTVFNLPPAPCEEKSEILSKECEGDQEHLSDLTLRNFFSAGWDDDWARRERATGTPDFALLRVQTNFLEREFRANYFYEPNVNSKKTGGLNDFDALMAWSFNRRFMIEIVGVYQWDEARGKTDNFDGGTPRLVGRVQLVDTEPRSISFNFQAQAPDKGLGQTQTTISYGIAGFEDWSYWTSLKRVGFYYSVFFDNLAGSAAPGASQSDVQYDITIAKTLTRPDTPYFGDFTLFVETFAQTNLSGSEAGSTLVSITPAFRFNLGKCEHVKFGKDNWLLGGVDLPVSEPKPWNAVYRFSYIKNF